MLDKLKSATEKAKDAITSATVAVGDLNGDGVVAGHDLRIATERVTSAVASLGDEATRRWRSERNPADDQPLISVLDGMSQNELFALRALFQTIPWEFPWQRAVQEEQPPEGLRRTLVDEFCNAGSYSIPLTTPATYTSIVR